jgi:hypothetical protein
MAKGKNWHQTHIPTKTGIIIIVILLAGLGIILTQINNNQDTRSRAMTSKDPNQKYSSNLARKLNSMCKKSKQPILVFSSYFGNNLNTLLKNPTKLRANPVHQVSSSYRPRLSDELKSAPNCKGVSVRNVDYVWDGNALWAHGVCTVGPSYKCKRDGETIKPYNSVKHRVVNGVAG